MSNPTVNINTVENIQWLDGSSCSYTLTQSNDIWRIRISHHIQQISQLSDLLSADEHERANRYYQQKDKHRFIISRAYLRILLGRYLNTDAASISFHIGTNKKPRVKGDTHLHYNVSHSGDNILIAISPSEVGIDVEFPDANIGPDEIIQVSYSKPEIDYVNTSPNKLQAFYTIWTRKEALLKATAKGIDDGLKFIPSVDGLHTTMPTIIGSEKDWIVNSFKVNDNHLGSIASAYPNSVFWHL